MSPSRPKINFASEFHAVNVTCEVKRNICNYHTNLCYLKKYLYSGCNENEKTKPSEVIPPMVAPMSGTQALRPRHFTLTNHKSGRINLVNKGFL